MFNNSDGSESEITADLVTLSLLVEVPNMRYKADPDLLGVGLPVSDCVCVCDKDGVDEIDDVADDEGVELGDIDLELVCEAVEEMDTMKNFRTTRLPESA